MSSSKYIEWLLVPEGSGSKGKQFKMKVPIQYGSGDACWECFLPEATTGCPTCSRQYHRKCWKGTQSICPECMKAVESETLANNSNRPHTEELKLVLMHIIKKMESMKGAEHFTASLVAYANPMNLNILHTKASLGLYGSTVAFLADVRWMHFNAITGDPRISAMVIASRDLWEMGEVEVTEIDRCMDCYISSISGQPDYFTLSCRKPHLLVWARHTRFPPWPAKVYNHSEADIYVRFFGDHTHASIPFSKCYPIVEHLPEKWNMTVQLERAINEMRLHAHYLKQKWGTFNYYPRKEKFSRKKIDFYLKQMLPDWNPQNVHTEHSWALVPINKTPQKLAEEDKRTEQEKKTNPLEWHNYALGSSSKKNIKTYVKRKHSEVGFEEATTSSHRTHDNEQNPDNEITLSLVPISETQPYLNQEQKHTDGEERMKIVLDGNEQNPDNALALVPISETQPNLNQEQKRTDGEETIAMDLDDNEQNPDNALALALVPISETQPNLNQEQTRTDGEETITMDLDEETSSCDTPYETERSQALVLVNRETEEAPTANPSRWTPVQYSENTTVAVIPKFHVNLRSCALEVLTEDNALHVSAEIGKLAKMAAPAGIPIQISSYEIVRDTIMVNVLNEVTRDWLISTAPMIELWGGGFTAEIAESPERLAEVSLPGGHVVSIEECWDILCGMNPQLDVQAWRQVENSYSSSGRKINVLLRDEHIAQLVQVNFRPFFCMTRATVKLLDSVT